MFNQCPKELSRNRQLRINPVTRTMIIIIIIFGCGLSQKKTWGNLENKPWREDKTSPCTFCV